MTVLLVKPMHLPCRVEIDNTLEAMQKAVGGPIQAVYPFEEPVALICHEEGKLLNLPLNRKLRHPKTGEVYDVIASTFFSAPHRRTARSLPASLMSSWPIIAESSSSPNLSRR